MYSSGLLSSDVLRWRLMGAAVWLLVGISGASYIWKLGASPTLVLSPWSALMAAFSLSAWWKVIKLAVAQSLAFAAHSAVVSTVEAQPAYGSRLLRAPTSAASLLLSKAVGRASTPTGLLAWLAYPAAHATSALLSLLLDSRTRNHVAGARWQLMLSACLALVHTAHVIYWSHDVVRLPPIQRHRYFRLKRRLPALAVHALRHASLALALALGADLALGHGRLSVTPAGAMASWLAASLCCLCWLLGVAVLDVVLSERLRPEDYPSKDVLGAMLACINNKQGEMMRDLVLHDFSCLVGERSRDATWRRQDVFADESGERWRPLGSLCISEVETLTTALAAALPQSQPKWDLTTSSTIGAAGSSLGSAVSKAQAGMAGAAPRAAKKWNALPLATKGALSVSRVQLRALAAVRCRYQRASLCIRTLAGFAEASLKEDKYGVLQLTHPGLGELLLCLLSALLATQHFARLLTTLAPRHISLGPWRAEGAAATGAFGSQSVDAAVLALQDTLLTSLYALASVFGEGLTKVLSECKAEPVFGSRSDVAALLQSILRGQE